MFVSLRRLHCLSFLLFTWKEHSYYVCPFWWSFVCLFSVESERTGEGGRRIFQQATSMIYHEIMMTVETAPDSKGTLQQSSKVILGPFRESSAARTPSPGWYRQYQLCVAVWWHSYHGAWLREESPQPHRLTGNPRSRTFSKGSLLWDQASKIRQFSWVTRFDSTFES